MVSSNVVAVLLLIGGQSPQTSPADNSSSIQVVHVPPVSDVSPVSALRSVSCVPPASVPSVSGIPPLPENHPTLRWCGAYIILAHSPPTTHYPGFQWVLTNNTDAAKFEGRAVVGGYEEQGSPLWVIRACLEGDLIPGKFSTKLNEAVYMSSEGSKRVPVNEFEVLLSQPGRVSWVADEGGHYPANAIPGGKDRYGMTYIGRAKHDGFIINGKIVPSHRSLYFSFNGRSIRLDNYEVLVADDPLTSFPHS